MSKTRQISIQLLTRTNNTYLSSLFIFIIYRSRFYGLQKIIFQDLNCWKMYFQISILWQLEIKAIQILYVAVGRF